MDEQREIENDGRSVSTAGASSGANQTRLAASAERRLLSPEELASYLGIPLATIYRWRSQRDGPLGIRVGRHVRYRPRDVERWLDERLEQRP
jgi:excisionase family DNA binding protein